MEKPKKKRPEAADDGDGGGGISGKKLKSHGGAAAEEEAELEEFNAILQRLRAGFNWIHEAKGGGDSAGKTAVTPPATAATAATEATEFEVGDFEQFHGGDVKMFAGDDVKSDGVVGFDLNVDPVTDQKCD